jgi:hypothetical protein
MTKKVSRKQRREEVIKRLPANRKDGRVGWGGNMSTIGRQRAGVLSRMERERGAGLENGGQGGDHAR